MGEKSNIEWTDASWTPIRARNLKTGKIGWYCEHSTTGCEFCYAEGMNKRLGTGLPFKPGHRKDVELFLDDKMLLAPLRWKKPRMIFVCSMTDLFAEFVPDEWIDKVHAVMGLATQHTFQVLTKRAARMRAYFADKSMGERVGKVMRSLDDERPGWYAPVCDGKRGWVEVHYPLPNVWLGVSAERQQEANERIPHLLQTPAAVRFVSAEPLLGPIDLTNLGDATMSLNAFTGEASHLLGMRDKTLGKLDWVIPGGESGPNARPFALHWADSIIHQCRAATRLQPHKRRLSARIEKQQGWRSIRVA